MAMIFNAANHKAWYCARCGTLKDEAIGHATVYTPKLVDRCREFRPKILGTAIEAWYRLGIAESISLPVEKGGSDEA